MKTRSVIATPAPVPKRPRSRRQHLAAGLVSLLAGVAGAPVLAQTTATSSATPPAAPAPAPAPCSAPENRQFDFWIGEWDVYTPDRKLAGTNRIEAILGGCVLHENWRGTGGFVGQSFNSYDVTDGSWHQYWVDGQGGRLDLEGHAENGGMVLIGDTLPGPAGPKPMKQRIRWTPLPDGAVRQLWESSEDGGVTWKVAFDGRYERKR